MLLVITNSGGGVKLGIGEPRNNGIFAIVTQELESQKGQYIPTKLTAEIFSRKGGVTQSLEQLESSTIEELTLQITEWVERRRNDRSYKVCHSS
jgi:hypothetical protein